MLNPTKYSNPDQTVIYMSMRLLKRLKSKRLEDYSELQVFAKKNINGGIELFLPSLNFLFLLGLINYHPKTDAIEYVGPK